MSTVRNPLPAYLAHRYPVMIVVNPQLSDHSVVVRSALEVSDALRALDLEIETVMSLEDAEIAFTADPAYCCVILGWGLCIANIEQAEKVIRLIRRRTSKLPIMLGMTSENSSHVPLAFVEEIDGFIWQPEDSPAFIAGRIEAAARRYLDTILPPFFGAMVNFAETHEYSWHTPGHTGGTAFMKTAVGRTFLDFYGEQMLRSDLSVSVGQLGSLNDHSGPVAAAEKNAARVFGADYTFFSVGGSSASNEIILHSAVTDGDAVLVDRNCHKSLNYALNMSGAIPLYLLPRRNTRGLIGPVPLSELTPEAIAGKISASPLITDKQIRPVLAVLTNSTYDGLCYHVQTTTRELSQSVDRIHYDEAWYAYARFNSLYENRYGMHRGERHADDATVTVTHSTHKLLAALSQASMIHIRSGKVPVKPALFNEAFMMHTSTSPQYSIIASTDVSAKMMDDAGEYLTDESIDEAITFRQAMVRLTQQVVQRNATDWWFGVWQPDDVDGTPFAEVDRQRLHQSDAWVLKPGAQWHGFGDLGNDYCMLDPIKVTLLTPGLDSQGQLQAWGIPAPLVSSFLSSCGTVVEKTEPYSILVLFSIGVTKGKWGSLVAAMMEFKKHYDANTALEEVMPDLVAAYPDSYEGLGLQDLAQRMHDEIVRSGLLRNMDKAFTLLPDPVSTPRATYAKLVKGNVEQIAVRDLQDRTVAVQVVPYPPGIPLMMPGEAVGADKRAIIDYLLAMEQFDVCFPGFEHDNHGIEIERDAHHGLTYKVYVVKQ
ncbi:Orn/Lys/Arg decarboxylase N-terminal domain-containing protein [Pseudomonas sp. MH9.2]|uniref:Orn/Lys/Arg family decarboxylase n=1 Tax=unclassified Pseudomonas TaxID=196821 RepID=UPI002AC89C5D|nr:MULTISPECIES: Orn/Lys/Arg decarboxylase N-terminal domain-containing protein [unclassified Pseudomonas]MEB0026008.1 Orn/Lys/Arg decarboxylase N-terminal domain-containing protein [Pseudomonas sp. MH9.2]MEE3505881.1 Orn/Lys/Arg decarboxylase N-terminal domain-containing protein [Pseudomonas sp. 10C3]WPX69478.1 Orn/Lys/Arg decarboxylase N-terminal domain-containing protein [Pseudomonas sp. MH9.2]